MLKAIKTYPIESLLLFSPAFHPAELASKSPYPLPLGRIENPFNTVNRVPFLRRIPRKAIVYSNSDYSTGRWFDLSQIVLNNLQVQLVNGVTNQMVEDSGFGVLSKTPLRAILLIPQLAWNFLTGMELPNWRA